MRPKTGTPAITLTKSGNGFVLNDTYLEAGSKLTIKYTAKATEDVNGMEVRNTATATAANIVKGRRQIQDRQGGCPCLHQQPSAGDHEESGQR